MKTKIFIVWACFALITGFFATDLKAGTPKITVNTAPVDTAKTRQQLNKVLDRMDEVKKSIEDLETKLANNGAITDDQEEEIQDQLNDLKDELASLRRSVARMDGNDNGKVAINDQGMTLRWGKDRDSTKKKHREWIHSGGIGLDLGLNTLLYNGGTSLPASVSAFEISPGHSWHVDLHLFNTAIRLLPTDKVYLTTSIDFNWNNYAFRKSTTITPKIDSVVTKIENFEFKKNKLTTCYVQIPLMLNFDSNPEHRGRSFHLAAGGYAGYLIDSYTKQISDERGFQRIHDSYNVNKISYGVSGSIGFSNVHLYVNYGLSSLFEKNKGPELTPLSFGITIIGVHL